MFCGRGTVRPPPPIVAVRPPHRTRSFATETLVALARRGAAADPPAAVVQIKLPAKQKRDPGQSGFDSDGFCEPDARRYKCGSCEKKGVFGTPELLLMGFVTIVDEEPETNAE